MTYSGGSHLQGITSTSIVPLRALYGRKTSPADDLSKEPIRQRGSKTPYVISYSGTFLTVISKDAGNPAAKIHHGS